MDKDIQDSHVSFPKDAFTQDTFNIDRFLQESCLKTGLHKLHKELGIYTKYLQSRMIDIVNSESNSIVNLSTGLKILRNKFTNISAPLGQLKEEVTQICKIIDSNLNNIKVLLTKRDSILAQKQSKIHELRMLTSAHKISTILEPYTNSEASTDTINMEILERSVDQYIMLQMYSQLCTADDSFQSQISNSTEIIAKLLNEVFLKSVRDQDNSALARSLQMYMMMNMQSVAENLYREKVVKPRFLTFFTENEPEISDLDFTEILWQITNFIKTDMKHLLDIVYNRPGLTSFNFILNSVWLEASDQMKLHLSSIFGPGNPSAFQHRYKITCDFLNEFEKCFVLPEQKQAFLRHPSYYAHKNLWNLPVYFEIRQQEIMQTMEDHLPVNSTEMLIPKEMLEECAGFRLRHMWVIWQAMAQCFDPDVYIDQLLDKFWKLELQIITRIYNWINNLLINNVRIADDSPDAPGEGCLQMRITFLCYLYLDVEKLHSRLKDPFGSDGMPYLNKIKEERLRVLLIRCLEEPVQRRLPFCLAFIEDSLVDIISTDCSVHVKQISQIPRLYRKTNKNIPTTPSPYLAAMTGPAESFLELYGEQMSEEVAKRILCRVHTNIIKEYSGLVENVLTSVTRTEESLRRLKKVRAVSETTETSTSISDDQKIRLQVQLDVSRYCEQAREFAEQEDINALLSLIRETTPS